MLEAVFDVVLFAELADSIPDLPGARCRGRAQLFDATVGGRQGSPDDTRYARRAALRLCASCPSLKACRDWYNALAPADRPPGVVAGLLHTWAAQ